MRNSAPATEIKIALALPPDRFPLTTFPGQKFSSPDGEFPRDRSRSPASAILRGTLATRDHNASGVLHRKECVKCAVRRQGEQRNARRGTSGGLFGPATYSRRAVLALPFVPALFARRWEEARFPEWTADFLDGLLTKRAGAPVEGHGDPARLRATTDSSFRQIGNIGPRRRFRGLAGRGRPQTLGRCRRTVSARRAGSGCPDGRGSHHPLGQCLASATSFRARGARASGARHGSCWRGLEKMRISRTGPRLPGPISVLLLSIDVFLTRLTIHLSKLYLMP